MKLKAQELVSASSSGCGPFGKFAAASSAAAYQAGALTPTPVKSASAVGVGPFVSSWIAVMSPPVGAWEASKVKPYPSKTNLRLTPEFDDRELRRCTAWLDRPGTHLLNGVVARRKDRVRRQRLDCQCRLVGNADQRNRDILRRDAAVAVTDLNRVDLLDTLTVVQICQRGIVDGESPRQQTGRIGIARVFRDGRGKCAEPTLEQRDSPTRRPMWIQQPPSRSRYAHRSDPGRRMKKNHGSIDRRTQKRWNPPRPDQRFRRSGQGQKCPPRHWHRPARDSTLHCRKQCKSPSRHH